MNISQIESELSIIQNEMAKLTKKFYSLCQ